VASSRSYDERSSFCASSPNLNVAKGNGVAHFASLPGQQALHASLSIHNLAPRAYNSLRLQATFTLATFDPADDCPSRGRQRGRGRPLGLRRGAQHHPYANTRPSCFVSLPSPLTPPRTRLRSSQRSSPSFSLWTGCQAFSEVGLCAEPAKIEADGIRVSSRAVVHLPVLQGSVDGLRDSTNSGSSSVLQCLWTEPKRTLDQRVAASAAVVVPVASCPSLRIPNRQVVGPRLRYPPKWCKLHRLHSHQKSRGRFRGDLVPTSPGGVMEGCLCGAERRRSRQGRRRRRFMIFVEPPDSYTSSLRSFNVFRNCPS